MVWLAQSTVVRVLRGEWAAVGLPSPNYHRWSRVSMRFRFGCAIRAAKLDYWDDPVELMRACGVRTVFNSRLPQTCMSDGYTIQVPARAWAFSPDFPLLVLHEGTHGLCRRQGCDEANETDVILLSAEMAVPESMRTPEYLPRFGYPAWFLRELGRHKHLP